MKRIIEVSFLEEYVVEAENFQAARIQARIRAKEEFDKKCVFHENVAAESTQSISDIIRSNEQQKNSDS